MKLKTTSQKETSAETGGATRDCETRPRLSGCLPFFPHDERCSASGRSLEENGGPRGQALSGNLELGWFSRPPPSLFLTVRPPASRRMDATAAGSCCCCCSSSCEAMPGDLSMIFTANAGTGDFPDRPAFWNGEGRPTAVKRRGGGRQHRRHVCVDRGTWHPRGRLGGCLDDDDAEWSLPASAKSGIMGNLPGGGVFGRRRGHGARELASHWKPVEEEDGQWEKRPSG